MLECSLLSTAKPLFPGWNTFSEGTPHLFFSGSQQGFYGPPDRLGQLVPAPETSKHYRRKISGQGLKKAAPIGHATDTQRSIGSVQDVFRKCLAFCRCLGG